MTIHTPESLQEALQFLPGWTLAGNAIEREWVLGDLKQALAFMVQVGILAEQADHHPEIINVYNRVRLRLNTHSAQAITSKDTDLAAAINRLNV